MLFLPRPDWAEVSKICKEFPGKIKKCFIFTGVKLSGHRDNLKPAYATINYNQLIIKNLSQ